jgi:hypothetical protein
MLCSHSIFRKRVALASAHITHGGRDGEHRWRIGEIVVARIPLQQLAPLLPVGSLFLLKPFLRLGACGQDSSLRTHCITAARSDSADRANTANNRSYPSPFAPGTDAADLFSSLACAEIPAQP